jgi:hypothetical protein
MEPATPAATTAVTVGLAALLAGAFGQVAAGVMMVLLAAIAGSVISLSETKKSTTFRKAVGFFFGAIFTALVLSWAIAAMISAMHPALNTEYTPTIIAFAIGTQSQRLSYIAAKITGRIEKKITDTDTDTQQEADKK